MCAGIFMIYVQASEKQKRGLQPINPEGEETPVPEENPEGEETPPPEENSKGEGTEIEGDSSGSGANQSYMSSIFGEEKGSDDDSSSWLSYIIWIIVVLIIIGLILGGVWFLVKRMKK